MKLSLSQAIVLVSAIVSIATLAGLGRVDGAIAVTILATLAGNALGYVNGKKVGRGEVLTEVASAVKSHLASDPSSLVVVTPTPADPLQALTADEQATYKKLHAKVASSA